MKYELKAVSLSHTSAPVDIRELIYLPESTCKRLLLNISEILGLEELLIFSTCNRTEVYYVSEQDLSKEIISLLCLEKGIGQSDEYYPYFQIINDNTSAITYLFEVSMGLHSTVLGDLQIANQVKQAYAWANELQLAGAFLHRLMHTIFHTNKRVHHETPYRDGAASVSYAASDLAEALTQHLSAPKILVIGLGEMGRDVARNLDPTIFQEICISNRTQAKAEALAKEIQATVIPFSQCLQQLNKFDVIISAISVEEPVIMPELFPDESVHSQFIVDLSVPRSVSPDMDALPYVITYNVDDIHERTAKVMARRQEAVKDVKRIIAEEIATLASWQKELMISPTIHKIKAALEQIRKEELSRYLKYANDKESQLVEDITKSMLHKILRMPVLHLKAACKRGEQENLIDVLNDLFDLERQRTELNKYQGKNKR